MADKNKKKGGSKGATLLFVILLLAVGVIAAGWFKPDLPVIGPLVSGFFEKGAAGLNKDGVYTVQIDQLVLDEQEFDTGENLDIQVIIKRVNKEGKEETVWDSRRHGANKRKVGTDTLNFTFSATPFEIAWRSGDQLTVEVWDYAGIGSSREAWFRTSATDKEFKLSGTQTLTLLKDGDTPRNPRVGGTNQIVFKADYKGPIPAEE